MKNHKRKVQRQYYLPVDLVEKVNRYCLYEQKTKSEVIEMAIKDLFKKVSGQITTESFSSTARRSGWRKETAKTLVVIALIMTLPMSDLFADLTGEGADTANKVLNLIGGLGALVGSIVIGYGLVLAAWKWKDDQQEAIDHLKGGAIGGALGWTVKGLSAWLTAFLK